MDPSLIILGIQATLRAAQAGANLFAEHARDRTVFLPGLELPGESKSTLLIRFLRENPQLVRDTHELSSIWDDANRRLSTGRPELIDAACATMLQHKAKLQLLSEGKEENTARREAKMLAAGRMVEQWREERKPPNALIRMALTLTDIGLEFVAAYPSLLGAGSRGEKLIAAFAKNMSAMIPDETNAFGPRNDFADRVLGIFLRSGLGALASETSTVFGDADIAKLVEGVAKPIVDALPESLGEQTRYRDFVDALAGPAAETAFRLLAENTESYLGKGFADDKALGAVTSALFKEIKATTHDGNIVDLFSEQGLIRLYQAGLGVAMERPGLFVGGGGQAVPPLFEELVKAVAGTLRAHPTFQGPLVASLATTVVDVVGRNAPALLKLNPGEPWERVAGAVLKQVTTGLSAAITQLDEHGSLKGALRSFSHEQLLDLGRVILLQVAHTPGMLGVGRSEVQAIITGMAGAMAADDNLLLSAAEWIQIAGVAARQAACNPGRLFGLSADEQGGALAATVIRSVLQSAGGTWTPAGRSARPLLFGETLQTVLEAALEALGGNVSALVAQPDVVGRFLQDLVTRATADPARFGSKGLVTIVETFVGQVVATGKLPTDADLEGTLSA